MTDQLRADAIAGNKRHVVHLNQAQSAQCRVASGEWRVAKASVFHSSLITLISLLFILAPIALFKKNTGTEFEKNIKFIFRPLFCVGKELLNL